MKKRFTEGQIIGMIKEQEAGLSVPEICRKYGIGQSTFFNCIISMKLPTFDINIAQPIGYIGNFAAY